MNNDMLARPGLDLGVPTDNNAPMLHFYGETLGFPLLASNEIIPGHDEHFYEMHGSWFKINTSLDPLEDAVTGFRELLIVRDDVETPIHLIDPDGLRIQLVPRGHLGIDEVGLVIETEDVDAERRFIERGLLGTPVGDGWLVGNTVLFLRQAPGPIPVTPIIRRGLTMLTLIVRDLQATHAHLLAEGASHGMRASDDPGVPGRCQFSFLRFPSGNWIELVQFAEGSPIPPPPEPNPTFEEFMAFRDFATPA